MVGMEMVEMVVTIEDVPTRSSWHASQGTLMEIEMLLDGLRRWITPESKRIDRYIHELAPQIRGMIRATQPTIIQSVILMAGTLTDDAVRCGTLTRSIEKRKEVVESSKQGGSWSDNRRAKVVKGFMAAVPTRNEYLALIQNALSVLLIILKVDLVGCVTTVRNQVTWLEIIDRKLSRWRQLMLLEKGNNQWVCYECGSPDH
nr:reverse transcriptase domain-containing protein [Tanacetum cinerariifolium]